MYEFVDALTTTAGNYTLPAEAVNINGVYLEEALNELEGVSYSTLYTGGRESLEKEFDYYEDTTADGSLVRNTRFGARVITVGFQLIASSNDAFRRGFNALNELLNYENVQIVFNDEDDKFFIGSPVMDSDIDSGSNSVVGEYHIYCADPFKYDVEEETVYPIIGEDPNTGLYQTFEIDYKGTYHSYPQYKAEFYSLESRNVDEDNAGYVDEFEGANNLLNGRGDCNYVAFMDDEKHILQFGNPDVPEESEESNEILNKRDFRKNGSYNQTSTTEEWTAPNKGNVYNSNFVQQSGATIGSEPYSYLVQQDNVSKQTLLSATNGTDCTYTATVTKVDGRTASSAKLHITVSMTKLTKAITKGATLTIGVYNGSNVIGTKAFKKSSVAWSKGSKHSVSFTVTVGAGSNTDEISTLRLTVVRQNGSYKSGNTTKNATGSTGALSVKTCKRILVPFYTARAVDDYYLTTKNFGAVVNKKYTGATLSYNYPLIGGSRSGCRNFDLKWDMRFCTGNTVNEHLQMGAFQCLVMTGDSMSSTGELVNPSILAGVLIYNNNKTSNSDYRIVVDGSVVKESVAPEAGGVVVNNSRFTSRIDTSWKNGVLGGESRKAVAEDKKKGIKAVKAHASTASCEIMRVGSEITIKLGDSESLYYTDKIRLRGNSTFFNKKAYKVCFGFFRYDAQPAFDWNGIRNVTFTKIPDSTESSGFVNPFVSGQTLVVDSSSGDVLLDGVSSPALGALGNDWERMCLTNGLNVITTAYGQTASSSGSVIRMCRSDEDFNGYDYYSEDGIDAEDDQDVTTYYVYTGSGSAPIVDNWDSTTESNYAVADPQPNATQFYGNEHNYFVVETLEPKFSITYRGVYL